VEIVAFVVVMVPAPEIPPVFVTIPVSNVVPVTLSNPPIKQFPDIPQPPNERKAPVMDDVEIVVLFVLIAPVEIKEPPKLISRRAPVVLELEPIALLVEI